MYIPRWNPGGNIENHEGLMTICIYVCIMNESNIVKYKDSETHVNGNLSF